MFESAAGENSISSRLRRCYKCHARGHGCPAVTHGVTRPSPRCALRLAVSRRVCDTTTRAALAPLELVARNRGFAKAMVRTILNHFSRNIRCCLGEKAHASGKPTTFIANPLFAGSILRLASLHARVCSLHAKAQAPRASARKPSAMVRKGHQHHISCLRRLRDRRLK